MPRISRVVLPDHLNHVTQRGVRSQVIFFEDADRDLYLRLMREQCDRFGVRVFVLLPDLQPCAFACDSLHSVGPCPSALAELATGREVQQKAPGRPKRKK